MSADPQDLGCTPDDDVLRMRIRIRPGELLYRPLQSCRSSAERTRLLLSLAIQGYLLGPGAGTGRPSSSGGCVIAQSEPGTGSPLIRGERREETRPSVYASSAVVGMAAAGLGSPELGSEDILDDLSFATVFKKKPE
jgi:hypothetical protein